MGTAAVDRRWGRWKQPASRITRQLFLDQVEENQKIKRRVKTKLVGWLVVKRQQQKCVTRGK